MEVGPVDIHVLQACRHSSLPAEGQLKARTSNIMTTLSGNKFQHHLWALRKQWLSLHNWQTG